MTQLDLCDHGLLKLYMVKRLAVAAIAISGKEIASTLTSRACSEVFAMCIHVSVIIRRDSGAVGEMTESAVNKKPERNAMIAKFVVFVEMNEWELYGAINIMNGMMQAAPDEMILWG